MRGLLNRALVAIAFGHFVVDINANLLPMMLTFVRVEQHLTYAQVGLVMACYSTTSSMAQPIFGYLADRFGSRWTLGLAVLWVGVFMGLSGTASQFALLVVLVTLAGLGAASYHPQGASSARRASAGNSATAISVFSLFGIGGFSLGPMVGSAVFAQVGLAGTLAFIPLGVIAALAIVRLVPAHFAIELPHRVASATSPRRIYAFALVSLLFVVVMRAWIESAVVTFTPQRFPDDMAYSSRLLFVILFGQALGTFVGGVLADRVGRRGIIIVAMLAMAPQIYLYQTLTGAWLFLIAITTGLTMGLTIPVTIVAAQELMPGNVGVASGIMMGFAFGLGGVGVAATGTLADNLGLANTLPLLAVLPLLGSIVAATCPITRSVRPGPAGAGG